jgi:hypothetical protein
MQELCDRELVSSQRTGLAETGKAANNKVNIRLEVKKNYSPQEPHHYLKLPPILLIQTSLSILCKKPINPLTEI